MRRAPTPEIGWIDVDVDDARAAREWFGGRARFETFQWHYDAFALPAGATRVLTNAFNANQAYVVADRHIGMQCHVEMTSGAGRNVARDRRERAAAGLCAGAAVRRGHSQRGSPRTSPPSTRSPATCTRAGRED